DLLHESFILLYLNNFLKRSKICPN
ncbi:unnamed protein product, partial [Adineta ricciae]